MFTGLVERTGSLVAMEKSDGGARLEIAVGGMLPELRLGESVAVNGCCLTVAAKNARRKSACFDLLAQTLRVTNLGNLRPGSLVNLERAMRPGDRFGGHFVQGHVDATVEIVDFRSSGSDHRLEIALPPNARGLVIPKGSICLDGISLTAAEVTRKSVVCWIIPHTLAITNLKTRRAGERLNVEWDMLGKHVSALLAVRQPKRQRKRKKA